MIANQEHLIQLKEGVKSWNRWRDENKVQPDLSSADLRYANLSGANLKGVNLTYTNLFGANLTRANLRNSNLMGADLRSADLRDTDFSYTDLSGTNLTHANLAHANLYSTIFSDVDLRQTKGLLEIWYGGSSVINLHTVQLPQDGSALHFLRGCGIPDEWIDFYRATMQQAIQYHSCFISYSTDDYEIAKRLHADLQNEGVRCWFAPHDLVPGDHFREKIDQAIHMQDKLLLILSTHSMKSNWVQHEVRKALNREINQNRTILFPISLDGSVFISPSAWVQELREERHIGDFTQWETYGVYKQKFQVLLKQLKSTEVKL